MRQLLLLSTMIFLATGCSEKKTQKEPGKHYPAATTQEIETYSFDTGSPITALAVIPAIGHRGVARIAVAHGDAGVAIYSLDGDRLWTDDRPAKLVGIYQGNFIIYRDDDGETVLDRYKLTPRGTPALVESRSPSPVAATTIQRTAYAPLGPVRIGEEDIRIDEGVIQTKGRATAVAAVKTLIPRTSEMTILYSSASGVIHYGPVNAYVE